MWQGWRMAYNAPMRNLKFLVLSLVVFTSVALAAEPKIEIHAWASIPQNQTSIARYRELAECGFTTSFSGFSDIPSTTAALDAAHAAGVKLFISLPQLESDPQATVKHFKDHPALAGYHLRDEPAASDFAHLAKWARQIQSADESHPCYVNLFPTYATPQQLGAPDYQQYVDRFVKEVPVPMLSFDHYPVVGKSLRGDWYQNLEIIRAASASAHKPFWAFALSVAHGPYPVPTIAHLRLQAFSDLAYGAKCIQYFTYWTPVDSQWNFHEAPLDPSGKRTATYDVVQQMNREIQALAPIFATSEVLAVDHTAPLPAGTHAFAPKAPIQSLTTSGGAVVSLLANADHRYLAVVNRDFQKPMTLTVQTDPAAKVMHLDKSLQKHALSDGAAKLEVSPGDICLFEWKSANP